MAPLTNHMNEEVKHETPHRPYSLFRTSFLSKTREGCRVLFRSSLFGQVNLQEFQARKTIKYSSRSTSVRSRWLLGASGKNSPYYWNTAGIAAMSRTCIGLELLPSLNRQKLRRLSETQSRERKCSIING